MKQRGEVAGQPTVREAGIVFVQVVLQSLQGASIGAARVLRQGRGGKFDDSPWSIGEGRFRNQVSGCICIDPGMAVGWTGVSRLRFGHSSSISPQSGTSVQPSYQNQFICPASRESEIEKPRYQGTETVVIVPPGGHGVAGYWRSGSSDTGGPRTLWSCRPGIRRPCPPPPGRNQGGQE